MHSTSGKPKVFIFDIDGTLADCQGIRSPYDESKVVHDNPIEPVWAVLNCLIKDYQVIFVSGRTDACKYETMEWLWQHLPNSSQFHTAYELHMRKTGDRRKDSIVKKEIYDTYILPYYEVIGVFDDRLQVCRMLYENNIFCFNVNQGLKEF
jgi:hypothetical protein